MAIYHCSAKVISRGSGRSAVAAAAYRSGTKIENEYDGVTHDYTRKQGVVYSEVMLPDNAPEAYRDRAILWNAVEKTERANGQLAQEYEFSIPIELPQSEWISFARRTADELFVKDGRPADIAIHYKETDGKPNPHIHIQSPKRAMDADGNWEAKSEILYLCKNAEGEEKAFTKAELALPENSEWQKQHRYSKGGDPKGKKVYLSPYDVATNPKYKGYERVKGDRQPKTEKHGRKNPKMERWDSKEYLLEIRKAVADKINAELERMGLPQRVDHRSLKDQGIDREPTIHEGVAARNIEKKGGVADRCEINREIKQANVQTAAIDKEMSEVERSVGSIKEDIAWSNLHTELYHIEEDRFANSWSEAAQLESLERLDKLAAHTAEIIEAQKGSAYHAGAVIEDKPYLDYYREKATQEQDYVRAKIGHSLDFIRTAHPHHEAYHYGKITPLDIDTRMRTDRDERGFLKVAQRSGPERGIIINAQRAHKELAAVYDTTQLQRLIAQQEEAQRLGKPAKNRDEELVRQIQESFANLKFLEQRNIYSTEQARATMVELQGKLDSCTAEIRNAEIMLVHLGREDAAKAAEYQGKVNELKAQLPALRKELEGYTRCVKIFDRIDSEIGRPRPALTGPVQEQTKKPERAADLPKAEPQAVPERKQPLDSKIAAAAKVAEQPKQPAKETPRVDLRSAEPKAVPFDVQKTAMQLVQHRADFIRESIKAQQPSYYAPNVAYRQQAQHITDCVSKIREFRDTRNKLEQQRKDLGLFNGKKKKELDGKITEFERRARQEEAKLEPVAKAMKFEINDYAGAAAAAKSLRELAAQEDAKAKAALANVGAAERANTAKLEYIALAKTVPEDKKQAVMEVVERSKPTEIPGLTKADIFQGEKLAKQQLDVVLKPEQVAAKEEQLQKADVVQSQQAEPKRGRAMSMEEVNAAIAAEKQKQAAQQANETKKKPKAHER